MFGVVEKLSNYFLIIYHRLFGFEGCVKFLYVLLCSITICFYRCYIDVEEQKMSR